jgi:hypothetical protein
MRLGSPSIDQKQNSKVFSGKVQSLQDEINANV